ncbi:MAG: lipase family alpha/beta hydrolase [Cellvibrionaceae bacterium]
MSKNILRASIPLFTCLFLSGCMFIDLNKNVKQIDSAIHISGKVEANHNNTSPIVVTLSRSENGKYPLEAYTVIYGADSFVLSAPPGQYYLLAFEDSNQDFTLQDNERVSWYGAPTLIEKSNTNIKLVLRNAVEAKNTLPTLYIPGQTRKTVNLERMNIGKVVKTDIFKQENGPLGMWKPVDFHLQGNTGIYFLEKYDPNKIPVLFVHGISGSGHDWLYFLNNMDRKRFQPWVVQYPSGIRLGSLSKSLSQSINILKTTYGFDRLAVVAHSMGGLVSRGFINDQLANHNTKMITTFITLSTPWLGHNAASQGTKFAPIAVPSWFDMVPDSPYLNSLHKQSLSEHIQYYLLFSHKGKGSIISDSNTDGTVTLASQLAIKAQEEAIKVIGYDENHVSILNSPETLKKVEAILNTTH